LRPFELAGRDPRGLLALARGVADASGDQATEALPKVDLGAWERAVQAGKLVEAGKAAQSIVDAILDMPAPIAAHSGSELQRAVEFLELAPNLGGVGQDVLAQFFVQRSAGPLALPPLLARAQRVRDTARADLPALWRAEHDHPRAASLALVSLAERVRKEVPNGWPGEIAAPASVWSSLELGYDGWLSAHPKHPLQDLAKLSKLRLIFLRGDGKRAWDLLLALYPRRTLRAAWEMRHLLLAEMRPTHVDVLRVRDPVLATALVRESNELSLAQWAAMWARAQQKASAAWSINLQERLFVQAMRLAESGQAPAELPGAPRAQPERWAELHTAALLAAGRNDEALAQAKLLAPKPDARAGAKLRAQAYMRQCAWTQVAEDAVHLGPDSLRYALEVLVDDASLRTLMQREDQLAARATHALALRTLREADWQAAADVWGSAAGAEAHAWRAAAKLATDASFAGRQAFAKWLGGSHGALILPDSATEYSRGLKRRLDVLSEGAAPRWKGAPGCDPPPELERLRYVLTLGGRRERMLQQYAEALRMAPASSAQTRSLLKSADAIYNRLLNADYSSSTVYPRLLAASPAVVALREAGKRLRQPSPAK